MTWLLAVRRRFLPEVIAVIHTVIADIDVLWCFSHLFTNTCKNGWPEGTLCGLQDIKTQLLLLLLAKMGSSDFVPAERTTPEQTRKRSLFAVVQSILWPLGITTVMLFRLIYQHLEKKDRSVILCQWKEQHQNKPDRVLLSNYAVVRSMLCPDTTTLVDWA